MPRGMIDLFMRELPAYRGKDSVCFFVYATSFIRPGLIMVPFVCDTVERIKMKVDLHPFFVR